MSSQVKLAAQPRTSVGKGDAKRIRREGRVPGILYGHGVQPSALTVDARDLYHALHGPAGLNALISLDDGTGPVLTVVRDIQRHPVRRDVMHVDFLAVDRDVRIDVDVPVHLIDVDDVARDGGFLNHVRHVVPITVRPLDTPDFFELSVAGMGIGDVKRLGDIIPMLPEGADIADDPDRVIVTINAPAGGGPAADAVVEATPDAAADAGASTACQTIAGWSPVSVTRRRSTRGRVTTSAPSASTCSRSARVPRSPATAGQAAASLRSDSPDGRSCWPYPTPT